MDEAISATPKLRRDKMTNLISIANNLQNNVALTPARFIGVSAINLINAGILANSTEECANEARRIYSKKCGGMWKKIQADAKKVLRIASKYNLTIEKPYFVENGIVYGILSDDFVPMFGSEKLN